MRKYQNEVLLVVVNFDKAEQTVRIQIPDEAFKALDFGDNKAAATDRSDDWRELYQHIDGCLALSGRYTCLFRSFTEVYILIYDLWL